MKKLLCIALLVTFFTTSTIGPMPMSVASGEDGFNLPPIGVIIHLSPPMDPVLIQGIKVYPKKPFNFEFIVDKGDRELSNDQFKHESLKLIKYFLASLTMPERDLWVTY